MNLNFFKYFTFNRKNKCVEVQAPNEFKLNNIEQYTKIFLAGSIEMGKAIMWQPDVISKLSNEKILFYNPSRDDWDSSWEQVIENPEFNKQVTWELQKQEESDIIIMYFDPNTISPVTLIEYGLHVKSGKLIVYCPDGYFKKGNIDITSAMYDVTMVNSFDELIETIKKRL